MDPALTYEEAMHLIKSLDIWNGSDWNIRRGRDFMSMLQRVMS